jgi:hypothetical protein
MKGGLITPDDGTRMTRIPSVTRIYTDSFIFVLPNKFLIYIRIMKYQFPGWP